MFKDVTDEMIASHNGFALEEARRQMTVDRGYAAMVVGVRLSLDGKSLEPLVYIPEDIPRENIEKLAQHLAMSMYRSTAFEYTLAAANPESKGRIIT